MFLDAAASGLLVLARDSGGSPETVRRAETGYVVHSADDIAEGLEILMDDQERAREMGEEGRRMVEAEFTWTRVVDRFLDGFSTIA